MFIYAFFKNNVMPEDDLIVIGRSKSDVAKYNTRGAVLFGKIYESLDEDLVLTKKLYLDVSGSHVMFICGKRGGGKSYTMGVVAEGFTLLEKSVRDNLAIILFDTMGIYWTMSHANKKEAKLLEEYAILPRPIKLNIFTPKKYHEIYKEKGIATDFPFTINPSQLTGDDWCMSFKQDKFGPNGVLINDTIEDLRENKRQFSLDDIIEALRKNPDADKNTIIAVVEMFKMAKGWGLFSDKGTRINELAKAGEVSVLDVSCYATMPGGWDVKALVVGIVSRHLFIDRMERRKDEEFSQIKLLENYYNEEDKKDEKMPLVWLVLDEAHEFLPKDDFKVNAATEPLVTVMREGRQPGISLILATQQPGKIHSDVLTQSDIVIAHRITARQDTEALGLLAQSYMKEGLTRAMDWLPRIKGTAVVFDDMNEKIYQIRIRPRFTWHGGSSPNAVDDKDKV